MSNHLFVYPRLRAGLPRNEALDIFQGGIEVCVLSVLGVTILTPVRIGSHDRD